MNQNICFMLKRGDSKIDEINFVERMNLPRTKIELVFPFSELAEDEKKYLFWFIKRNKAVKAEINWSQYSPAVNELVAVETLVVDLTDTVMSPQDEYDTALRDKVLAFIKRAATVR